MGVTRLKRKDRRNKVVANGRVATIKQQSLRPVIKNVDIEELKASFSAAPAKKATKKAAKAESTEETSAE